MASDAERLQISEPQSASTVAGARPAPGPPDDLRQHVEKILDLIRPSVQSDGGDVELVEVSDDGVVRVRFHGACVGCPSVSVTLQHGIERALKQYIPEIKSVQSVA